MSSRFIHRIIGDPATDLISRVMGVFIAAIAISFMRLGVLDVIAVAQHPEQTHRQQQRVAHAP